MTVVPVLVPIRIYLAQALMLLSVNVPTLSFGLALGWVSLASGSAGSDESEGAVVAGAAATCAAGLLAVPLAASALRQPRRYALAATSAAFTVCWALTWCGGWWLVLGRVCAGIAGALAWTLAPVLGPEACQLFPAAAAAAPVLAHAAGMLLMYLAGYLRSAHSTVVWSCLALSALHSVAALLTPETPPTAIAEHPPPAGLWAHTKDLLSDGARRRAFIIALIAVSGQEACGLLSLLQFAERVFLLAGGETAGAEGVEGVGDEAARAALLLGAVQFVAAAVSLILLERVKRRPLLVWCAGAAGVCLAAGATAVAVGLSETVNDLDRVPEGWKRMALVAGASKTATDLDGVVEGWNKTATGSLGASEKGIETGSVGEGWSRTAAAGALCTAVAADALGLQPAPYALLYDMFHHQYRGCAVLLVMGAASAANAAETLVFPILAGVTGLPPTLALAAGLTLLYTTFVIIYVPETKDKTVDEIYNSIYPERKKCDEEKVDVDVVQVSYKHVIKDRPEDDLYTNVNNTEKNNNDEKSVAEVDDTIIYKRENKVKTCDDMYRREVTALKVDDSQKVKIPNDRVFFKESENKVDNIYFNIWSEKKKCDQGIGQADKPQKGKAFDINDKKINEVSNEEMDQDSQILNKLSRNIDEVFENDNFTMSEKNEKVMITDTSEDIKNLKK